ncbi:pyridoxine 5'-phosphate oxidase C-terminal domain-containing protein [Streptomyces mirabilis]|uniref:pyridoxine 5'-phosphate oxidase C-terminal domain-containing protein n=1 Tax=Streptomyces mirabilis TaxID=68239 RepID=UPI0036B2EE06
MPRPAGWTGYRLVPESTEFLYASPDRLHRRLRYDRDQGHDWSWQRLQPCRIRLPDDDSHVYSRPHGG